MKSLLLLISWFILSGFINNPYRYKPILNPYISIVKMSDVTLQWEANTEPDLAGYRIYYGIRSGFYSSIIDVGNVIEFTITKLPDGMSYYFVATAYDNEIPSLESDYSNEVIYYKGLI